MHVALAVWSYLPWLEPAWIWFITKTTDKLLWGLLAGIVGPAFWYYGLYIFGKHGAVTKAKRKQFFLFAAVVCFFGAQLFLIGVGGTKGTPVPDLQPRLQWISIGIGIPINAAPPSPPPERPVFVVFGVEVVNRGSATIIRDWKLVVELPNGPTLGTTLVPVPAQGGVNVIEIKPGQSLTLKPSNWLVAKVRGNSILQGDLAEGFLQFSVPDVDRRVVTTPGARFILTFSDSNDRVYRVDHLLAGQVPSTF